VHPGFDDREGFGRREITMASLDVERLVLEQIITVASAASDEDVELQHVKPHGALYNMAARDLALASAIAGATALFDRNLRLVGPPGSQIVAAGRTAGLRTMTEAFAAPRRGWEQLYVEHVRQADTGADLDFLVGVSGSHVPRESH